MKSFGKTLDLLVVFLAILIIPRLARLVSSNIFPLLNSFDPDSSYAWISIHHIAQFVFTIILMKLWFKTTLKDWGFNLNEFKLSIKIFGCFCLGYLVLVFLNNILPRLVSGVPPLFDYPLNARNVAGVLSFQFLLSGTCEEPLFRGFVMTVLAQSWKGSFYVGKLEIPSAGLWATLFFMIAHIGFSFSSFGITHFSISQQIASFALGLYYAILFHKTKSLLGPILSHGYSNGVLFVTLYVLTFLMR